jgi:hypothetical protein
MSESERDDRLGDILKEIRTISSQVGKMNRGLYGDDENKQPGLMQKHYEVEGRVKKLEKKDERRTYMIAGATSIGTFSLPMLWKWITETIK